MPQCDNEDGSWAVTLVSNTENGDTLAMCGPCLVGWARIVVEGTGAIIVDPPPGEQSAPTVPSLTTPEPDGDDDEHDEDTEPRGFAPATIDAALGDTPPQDVEVVSNGDADAEPPAIPPAGQLADAPPY